MRLIIIKFFIIIFSIFFANFATGKISNNIVVKIENEIITSFDIKNKILASLILSKTDINQENINKIKKQSLNALIQYKLMKNELKKFNITEDETQVRRYLQSISSNNVQELKSKFLNYGLDFDLFLDEIKTRFKWQKLIYGIYAKKVTFDESLIDKEAQNIIKSQSDIEEFRISEIEIFSNNDQSDKINIKNIIDSIKKIGFEETAVSFSISSTAKDKGALGWVNAKTLSPEIYKEISIMNIGEITKPIKRQESIIFLKLNDKKILKAKDVNIVALKKNLVNQKKNELFNLYSKSHLSKIKNNTLIEYK